MLFIIIFGLVHIPTILSSNDDIIILSENLKANLRVDPFLLESSNFEFSKPFIDRKIENFIEQMSWTPGEHYKTKRSLSDKNYANYTVDIETYGKIPANHPRDIVIFQQAGNIYAVILEENHRKKEVMRIKKYKGDSFVPISETEIPNAVRAAVFPTNSAAFIVAARNDTSCRTVEDQTIVFAFDESEGLEEIQKINASSATDVVIWEDRGSIFMTISQYQKQTLSGIVYTVDFPLYRWRGRHFDRLQYISSSGSRRVTPFSIHNIPYLALANSKATEDNGKIYSHVLRFNFENDEYKLYQRLQTFACSDMKYFKIQSDQNQEDHFLVVGNAYHEDSFHRANYNTRSIIYKFIDNYFIPFQSLILNGVREWLPIEVEDGNVILLASTMDGIKSFQYDGWHFVESRVRFHGANPRDVRAMHAYKVENKTVLVLADATDNGSMKNLFTFTFTARKELDKKYDELMSWCLESTEKLEDEMSSDVLGDIRRGDDEQEISSDSQLNISSTDELNAKLQSFDLRLSSIDDAIGHFLQTEGNHTIKTNITASNLIFQDKGILRNPQVVTINNIIMSDILNNILDMNEGFDINSTMEFNSLQIEEPLLPKTINGIVVDNLIHLRDDLNVDEIVVNGTVTFKKGINISGTLNGMDFDNDHLLKTDEDQEFDKLNIESVVIDEVTVDNINNVRLSPNSTHGSEDISSSKLEILKVKNMQIGGYLNDFDIATIDKYALRINGDQEISKPYTIENLEIENMDVELLSGKRPSNDLILITGGSYSINKDVKFTRDLEVNNLTVLEHLDSLAVKDGELDVLLRDSEEMQYVSGVKSFENLELLNPINLRGKINGKLFDSMNPAVQFDFDLQVDDDVTITGNVTVEKILVTKDILGKEDQDKTNNSFLRVARHGVKLTDAIVPIHLNFSQHIDIKELFTDRINNVDPRLWVENGAEHTQMIRGEKHFQGDLEITGDIVVSNINDIDMEELQTNVLRREGDQVIGGKHHVKYVSVQKKIINNNITFGNKNWTDVVTTIDKQEISGPIIFGSNLSSSSINITNLETKGFINGIVFADLFNDAYTKDSNMKLFGEIIFKNLTIDHLDVNTLKDHLSSLADSKFSFKHLESLQNMSAKNIYFEGECNGVSKNMISNRDDGQNETRIGIGNDFGTITAHGQVFLKSNKINDFGLDKFENDTVKIDEPFEFNTVTFDEAIIVDEVELEGQVENLDLDNVFQNDKDIPQIFPDKKLFQGNVTVAGTVHINGYLNGANVPDLCGFGSDARDTKALILEGNVHFAKGPDVFRFNGYHVRNFTEDVWFSDRPATIDGYIKFKGNSKFEEDITVEGIVNDIDLHLLSTTYLSKSLDQDVAARVHFLDDVIFEQDIASPNLTIQGKVNGIDIDELTRTVLLNRPQVFEQKVYLENCTVRDAPGTYSVNGLNLQTEVMRYDRTNMIIGPKRFKNLDIGVLWKMEGNITVQDVNLNDWFANAVLTAGSFLISGKKSFGNATFQKGIGLTGTINGLKFNKNSMMSKSNSQTIQGRKMFMPTSKDSIKFKSLKAKGLVNGVDVAKLVRNRALNNNGYVFESPLIFHNNITTRNINFRSLYEGLNVTEFINNVTKLGTLNDMDKYYKRLLDMSTIIERSLKDQAYYLNHYKRVHFASMDGIIHAAKCHEDADTIMVFKNESGSCILSFFEWNKVESSLEETKGHYVNFGPMPQFFTALSLQNQDYIYLEYRGNDSQEDSMEGKLIRFENATNFNSYPFETKGTTYLTSFYMEIARYYCLLFIDYSYHISIMCTDFEDDFHLHQTILSPMAHKASLLVIDEDIFMITISISIEEQARVIIWKMHNCTLQFEIYQTIETLNAISMDTVSFGNNHFVAIAHGHLKDTLDYGRIEIFKYERSSQIFRPSQHIMQKAPIDATFAVLPSQELVLYVVTGIPTEMLNVYIYEGITGFTKKAVDTTIAELREIMHVTTHNQHFVFAVQEDETKVLQAVFKGQHIVD